MKQNTERLLPQVGPMWGQKAGADGGANWGANGNQSLPQREKKDIALEHGEIFRYRFWEMGGKAFRL